jgi:hypothetical protein
LPGFVYQRGVAFAFDGPLGRYLPRCFDDPTGLFDFSEPEVLHSHGDEAAN